MTIKPTMRIDQYLTTQKLSRTKAQSLIKSGLVTVNGRVIKKPGFIISDTDNILFQLDHPWVSRAALKLIQALELWPQALTNKTALDIGASTGGFTQVLLFNNISQVIAVDVGHDQLHEDLKNDPRVINLENQNIRNLAPTQLGKKVDLVVGDVSFISLTIVLPLITKFMKPDSTGIFLIKPQFEVGPQGLDKHGVVKSEKLQQDSLTKIITLCETLKFTNIKTAESALNGKSGNKEFLIRFTL